MIMPYFSNSSKEKLSTCRQELQNIFNEVIKYYDCVVICGHRGEEDQNRFYDKGSSKVKWPNGKHNTIPSMAVDVMPYPINWNDYKRFYFFAGFVKGICTQMGYNIRWGGDWNSNNIFSDQKFNDLVHFELVM